MQYRWKLLILLLSIAVLPVMAGRFLGASAFGRLEQVFISQTRAFLTRDAQNHLKQVVHSYAEMLAQDHRLLDLALSMQAQGIEGLLTRPAPAAGQIRFAEDFQPGNNPPADLALSPMHFKTDAAGTSRFLEVSYGSPVFRRLSPAADQTAKAYLRKMAGVGPVFHKLSKALGTRIIWQYTVLESGVFCAYPGYDGFDENFYPRIQPWYRRVLHTGRRSWTIAYADPETGRMVAAAAMPIKGPGGEFIGVTAIVAPANVLMERMLFLKDMPSGTRPFLVHLIENPETGKNGALIVARSQTFPAEEAGKQTGPHKAWLAADDKKLSDQIMGDFEQGGSNARRVLYHGIDTLWVYGQVTGGTFLVLVMPYDGIVERASQAEKTIQAHMDQFLKNTRTGGILVLIVAVVIAFAFSRTVSKPVKLLMEGANRLGSGDLDVRVDIRSTDEFARLGKLFNQVVPQLKERLQMGQSLALAREVQQNLLPRRAPISKVFSIEGASVYCDGTGGDYYDFISFGNERPDCIGVVVGDVAGHGISSALLMTTARALIRQRSGMPGTLAAMVNDVNRSMVNDVEDSGQFMTLFYACLDQRRCTIQWVCAGHDPAIIFDQENGTFESLGGAGLPLGALAEASCRQYTKRLAPGMIIAMGTDGIWETRNAAGEMFGRERFRQVIRTCRRDSAPAIVDAVMAAVEAFRSGAQQEDDVTLAVIKVNPNVA